MKGVQTERVQSDSGVAPEFFWKYEGPAEKVGVPATFCACRCQQQQIRVCPEAISGRGPRPLNLTSCNRSYTDAAMYCLFC